MTKMYNVINTFHPDTINSNTWAWKLYCIFLVNNNTFNKKISLKRNLSRFIGLKKS